MSRIIGGARDIVVRITGQNLLGGPVRDARRDIDNLRKTLGGTIGGAQGKFFSAALTGGAAGLVGGAAAGTLAPALMGQVMSGLKSALDMSEHIASAFGIVTERAREVANAFKATADTFRANAHKMIQGEVEPARAASERAFGGLSMPSGFPMSLFGSRSGQLSEEVRKIQASRDKIAKQMADRTEFGQLRAKFMQQENQATGFGSGMRASDFLFGPGEKFLGMIGLADVGRKAGSTIRGEQIREMRDRAGARARREIEGINRSRGLADAELQKQQNRIQALMGIEAGAAGLGARFGAAGVDFSRMGGNLGGIFGRTFGRLPSMFGEQFSMNREMRLQTESPAERLRREMGNLEAMRGRGLTDEMFGRRRRSLLMDAIGQLPPPERTPGLAATEGRFLQMGRRNEVKDELSAFRREAKMNTKEQTKELVAAIRGEAGTGSL